MNDNQKCADYLKSKDLHRFMLELKKRWQRYGCFKGRIPLKNTSVSERNALTGILFVRENSERECTKRDIVSLVSAISGKERWRI